MTDKQDCLTERMVQVLMREGHRGCWACVAGGNLVHVLHFPWQSPGLSLPCSKSANSPLSTILNWLPVLQTGFWPNFPMFSTLLLMSYFIHRPLPTPPNYPVLLSFLPRKSLALPDFCQHPPTHQSQAPERGLQAVGHSWAEGSCNPVQRFLEQRSKACR